MLRTGRGTIVTISSVLGHIGAAQLSDYSAAKAGLIALHKSLTAELRNNPEIKTVLVTPGQLTTPMFQGVDVGRVRGFFGPVIEPVDVAKEIIKAIDGGSSCELAMPFYARWIDWLNVMPVGMQRIARWASGLDKAMEGFEGRGAFKSEVKESLI